MKKGITYGVGAYALWGFFPVYWKLLKTVPAIQLIGHRIVWSCIFLLAVIAFTGQWTDFRKTATLQVIRVYAIAALLIGGNWYVYVWAVNAGYIVETSLGYFINPLVSVMLGVIFFKEKLRPAQWLPVGIAAAGVTYLAFVYGRLPYIALILAFTFGLYGMAKKLSPLGSLYGLTIETGILFVPALAYLLFVEARGTGAFFHTGLVPDLLMIGAGLVTTVPLLMFASAARSIPLWAVGLLQYIAPTIQFLLGVFVYKENFNHQQLIGFSVVWLALAIFLAENYFASRVPAEPIAEMGEG